MHLYAKRRKGMSDYMTHSTAIQFWRCVPNEYESLLRTTNGPHNQHHTWHTGEGGTPFKYGSPSTKIDTTAASNLSLNPADDSEMGTPASWYLVFGTSFVSRNILFKMPCKQYSCLSNAYLSDLTKLMR